MRASTRLILLFIFLTCSAVLGYALYLQEAKHLLPCPLCVVQRIAYWLTGIIALLGLIHHPKVTGRKIYGGLLAITSIFGALVAFRHAWLIRYPEAFECGISPEERFLNALPLAKWWPGMFEANGDCAKATWKFLTLNIPDWSLICFAGLFALAVYLIASRNKQ